MDEYTKEIGVGKEEYRNVQAVALSLDSLVSVSIHYLFFSIIWFCKIHLNVKSEMITDTKVRRLDFEGRGEILKL